jgi:hypothetical protein
LAVRNASEQQRSEEASMDERLASPFDDRRQHGGAEDEYRLPYVRDCDRIVNTHRFAVLGGKPITTKRNPYTGLLFAWQSALNAETLARIVGANRSLTRAATLAYFVTLPTGAFFAERLLRDRFRSSFLWFTGIAACDNVAALDRESVRQQYRGLNLTKRTEDALRQASALKKAHELGQSFDGPRTATCFEAVLVFYGIAWTEITIAIRALSHDGLSFDNERLLAPFGPDVTAAFRATAEPGNTERAVDALVEQLGLAALEDLRTLEVQWERGNVNAIGFDSAFFTATKALGDEIRTRADANVSLIARRTFLSEAIERLFKAYSQLPVAEIPWDYRAVAKQSGLDNSVVRAWYSCHAFCALSETELRNFIDD